MARGSSKSDVREAQIKRRTLKGAGEDIAQDDADINLVREVMRMPGSEKKAFLAFNDALKAYAGGLREEKRNQKEVRQSLVNAFNKLPESLRAVLTAPKETIDKLYRGATHRSNPGPDGTTNASFTTNKEHAEFFVGFLAEAGLMMPGSYKAYPRDEHRVYSAKDIESFGDIIDISRAMKLRVVANAIQSGGPFKEWMDEQEYMVTKIKWRYSA